MMSYQKMAEKDSMHNTPPCYNIYILGLVLKWILKQGGVEAMAQLRDTRSNMLYDFLDNSKLFKCPVVPEDRSGMNAVFTTGDKELDTKFASDATKAGFSNLAGHRNVGGMRASIYNAMPVEGVSKLVAFMKDFEQNNS